MRPAPRLLTTAGLGVSALLLAACGTQVGGQPGSTGTGIPSLDEPVSTAGPGIDVDPSDEQTIVAPDGQVPRSAAFDDRAAEVASAWLTGGLVDAWRQGLVPLASLTTVPDFTPRPELKLGFLNGWVSASGTLPTLKRPDGVVTVGGASLPVGLLTADKALAATAPQRGPDCRPATDGTGCAPVEVTGATLTTTTLLTNRGEATVAAWAFTVDGLTEPLVQVAISPEDLAIPPDTTDTVPGTDGDRTRGVVSSQSLIAVGTSTVTYSVGVGACDNDIVPRVVETTDLVLVGATVTTAANAVCTDQLLIQPVQVETAAPIGDRPVVDALTGAPVLPPTTPR